MEQNQQLHTQGGDYERETGGGYDIGEGVVTGLMSTIKQKMGELRGRLEILEDFQGNKKDCGNNWSAWLQIELPEYEGTEFWEIFVAQINIMFDMYGCFDGKMRGYKIVEALRGKARTFFASQTEDVRHDYEKLCEAMQLRFGQNEPPSIARHKLYQVMQNNGELVEEFGERVTALMNKGYRNLDRVNWEILATEFFLKGLNDKGVAYSVIDKDPGSISEAIKLVHAYKGYRVLLDKDIYLDSFQRDGNCSNMRRSEDNNLNINYGGVVGTTRVGFNMRSRRGQDSNFNTNHGGITQTSKVSSNMRRREDTNFNTNHGRVASTTHNTLRNWQNSPQFNNQLCWTHPVRENGTGSVWNRGQSFRRKEVRCYGCNKLGHIAMYCPEGLAGSKRLVQSEITGVTGNREGSKSAVGEMAGNEKINLTGNEKINLTGQSQRQHCRTRGDIGVTESKEHIEPHVMEVKFRERVAPCSLVIDVCMGGVPCEAVIDSGAQVTVINKEIFGKLKGAPKVNHKVTLRGATKAAMEAWVVYDFEITVGGIKEKNKVFVAEIEDNCIFGLDSMKLFKMVLDLNKGVVGVGHKVIPGNFKYVGGDQVPLYPMRTINQIQLTPESVSKVEIAISGAPKGQVIVETGFPDCRFFMPATVLECEPGSQTKEVWLINDSREKMLLPKDTLLGVGQQLVGEEGEGEVDSAMVRKLEKNMEEGEGEGTDLPGYLVPMFEKAREQLNEEQARSLRGVLVRFKGVFAKHDMDLGNFSAVKHKIDVGGAKPVHYRPRRTPLAFENEEKEHLEKLLDANIISPGASEWASPTVLVRKRDGTVRYCIDLRGVNKVTIKDKYPLPKISECIDALAGCDYFSCLDMANGYYQLKMDDADKDKTAFVTKYGMFLYNRMPFGLCNAPATFSRALALVLRGLSWSCVVSFLDDLIILGKGFQNHLENMVKVFERFEKFKLKLKPKKCELLQKEVVFLGHKVNREGVTPNPAKLEEVSNWEAPGGKKDLESFLGLAGYYREYVKDFAKISAPLHALTGAKVPFIWGEVEKEAFQLLKKRLTESPVLVYPKGGGGFILDTDASGKAIGGVLSQVQDGVERVVGYGSYILSAAQQNYCVTRKELLAVVTFTKFYRHYLLGNNFVVRTDHHSLVWLMGFRNIEGQLARWIEELQGYDMELKFRPGRHHGNADGLSRKYSGANVCNEYRGGVNIEKLPCGGCKFCKRMQEKWGEFEEDVDYVVPLAVRVVGGTDDSVNWGGEYTKEEIGELQNQDVDVGKVKKWVETGEIPQRAELMLSSPEVKYLWGFKEMLEIREGVLMYSWLGERKKWILVAPKGLRQRILEHCHAKGVGGHFGIDKTRLKVREFATWYMLRESCEDFVKGCGICNRQKRGAPKPRGEQQLFHAGHTLERVHIDIMGPLMPTQQGNKYVLVIVDQFTKWVEAYPLKDQTGETVARVVAEEFIARFGCPLEIHTDQGRNFEGVFFKELCKIMDINKTRTTSYRPSANGQVERLNRSIAQIIRCCVHGKQEQWDEFVALAASAIRATVNRSTGFTPNDLRKRVTELKLGDVVLKRNNVGIVGGSKKLNDVWKGEWVITEVKSPVLFKVKNNKKSMVVHHDMIKICGDKELPGWAVRMRSRILDRNSNPGSDTSDEGLVMDRSGQVASGGSGSDNISGSGGHQSSRQGGVVGHQDDGTLADTEFSGDDRETVGFEDTGGKGGNRVTKNQRRGDRTRKTPKYLEQFVCDSY